MAANRKPVCVVCKTSLPDNGVCMYRCPPEAAPSHLKAMDRKVKERQRRADRGDIGAYLTPQEASAGVRRAVPRHADVQDKMRSRVVVGWKNRR